MITPKVLKNNKKIIRVSKASNMSPLLKAYETVMQNYEFVLNNIHENGLVLQYASFQLKDNKDLVLVAVKQCGSSLMFASNRLQNDEDVVLAAVHQNGAALEFASDRFRNDRDLLELYCNADFGNMRKSYFRKVCENKLRQLTHLKENDWLEQNIPANHKIVKPNKF